MFVGLAKRARSGRFEPNADVYLSDDGTDIVVNVEIAGAEPAELRIGIDERHLFIIGRREDRARTERGSVLMKEIEFGEFVKKIHLPVAVEHRDATASYCDGILSIRLPISESALRPVERTEIRMTVRRILA